MLLAESTRLLSLTSETIDCLNQGFSQRPAHLRSEEPETSTVLLSWCRSSQETLTSRAANTEIDIQFNELAWWWAGSFLLQKENPNNSWSLSCPVFFQPTGYGDLVMRQTPWLDKRQNVI